VLETCDLAVRRKGGKAEDQEVGLGSGHPSPDVVRTRFLNLPRHETGVTLVEDAVKVGTEGHQVCGGVVAPWKSAAWSVGRSRLSG
jgi:hypothetical protein